MKKLLIAVSFFTLVFSGCSKDVDISPVVQQNESDEHVTTTIQTRASAAYQINPDNPYSLVNVQRALDVIQGSSAPDLMATHKYIRLLPRSEDDLRLLTNTFELEMFPYPFDYDLTDSEIAVYENTLINGYAWQYAIVPVYFSMPAGVSYEILDYAYMQAEEETSTRAGVPALPLSLYDSVIDKAMEITGYASPQTRAAAWQPSATIKYNSGVSGEAIMPLKNVRVRANTTFNSGEAYTDASGNVTIRKGWGGKFKKATRYKIIWSKEGQWKIHDMAGKAKTKGPKQKAHWNCTISGDGSSHDATSATIHRALNAYYNETHSKTTGLRRYNNIDVKEHHGDYKIVGLSYIGGSFDNSMLTNEIHIYGEDYDPYTTAEMLASTFHELGHASHRSYVGSRSGYENASLQLQETWARGVEFAYTSSFYPNSYADYMSRYTSNYTAVIESLMWQGITLQQLQTIFLSKTQLSQCIQPVKDLPNTPDILIDALFGSNFQTKPLRVNLMNPITGSNTPAAGVQVSYSVPTISNANAPSGTSFNGWTISPSSGYTVSSGTSGTNLAIKFNTSGQYTLSAKFTLPGNILYTATKTITVGGTTPPPVTPVEAPQIYTYDAQLVTRWDLVQIYGYGNVYWCQPNRQVTFTVSNYDPAATYNWSTGGSSLPNTGTGRTFDVRYNVNSNSEQQIECLVSKNGRYSYQYIYLISSNSFDPYKLPVDSLGIVNGRQL